MRGHLYPSTSGVFAFGLTALLVGTQIPQTARAAAPRVELTYNLQSGMVIDREPPPGWTHLVIKSEPRVESGDKADMGTAGMKMATLFRTVVVAKVARSERDPKRFRLARVGTGLCMPFGGKDRVVSTANPGAAGESLGFVERTVLDRIEKEQAKARIIAQTETFALLATPATMKVGPKHEQIYLLYSMMVNPVDGTLSSVVWSIAAPPERRAPARELVLLPPNLVYKVYLDVQSERLLGAIPINFSCAMLDLPPGHKFAMSKALQAISADPSGIARDPAGFEAKIRATLAGPAPKPGGRVTTSSGGITTRSSLPAPR